MEHEWEQAARRGDVETLRRQFAAGADIDARDRHDQTALMIAAREGNAGVVRFLVEQGVALNHSAKYRLSALMLAVIHGHIDIVRTLVEAGANLAIRGSGAPGFSGKTALDLATAQGRFDIAEVLRKSE